MLALASRRWILLPLLLVLFSNVLVSHATPLVVCTPTASSWSTESFYSYCASRFTVTAAIGANLNDSTIFSSIDTTTGYLDRTTTIDPVTLYRGGTYASTITWGVALGYQEAQVWIDFNDNGIFESSEEVTPVSPYSTTPPPNPMSMAISIPSSAAVGTHLMRMRSIMEVTSTTLDGTPAHLDPCLIQFGSTYPQYYAGDVVDYKVTIQNPPPSLTFSKSSVAFGNVSPGATSVPPQVLSVSGADLLPSVGTITLSSSSSDFLVSTDGTTWGATATFTYSGSSFSSKNMYVQFAPGTTTPSAGTISFSGGGLSGAPAVTASGTGNATTCSGMPAAGTAVVSPTSGSGTTVFTLSLTGATVASGLFYQWQSSTSGTTWTNVPDAIYPTCSFMGTGALYYRAIVTCGIGPSATSTVATITPTVVSSGCSPTFGNPGASCSSYNMYFRISSLTGTSGSITDGSGCNGTTNYEDMTSSFSVTLNQGATYDATIQTGYPSYFSGQVWIDFNDDGQFSTTESVGGNGNFTATSEVISLGIPSGAIPGMHRMRVVGNYRGCCGGQEYPTMNPCPNSGIAYGDCRDYKVVIAGNATCSGTPAAGIVSGTPTNGCSGLNATLFNIGETTAGTTFQWQSSASASSGFTNISGATFAVYSPTVASTTYYRTVVTCAASGLSSNTPSLQLAVSVPAGVITGAATVCIGNTTTFSDTASGGSWSSSNTTVATVGSSSGIITGVVSGTAVITYSHGGCYATKPITVDVMPYAGVISGIDSVCILTTTTLTSSVSGGIWSSIYPGQGTIDASTGVAASTISWPIEYPDWFLVQYTVSNSCGSDSAQKMVVVMPPVSFGDGILGPDSVCLGSPATYSLVGSPGYWAVGWTSTPHATATIDSATGILSATTSGELIVQYIWLNNFCPATSINKTITVGTVPPSAGTISGAPTVAAGSSIALSSTVSGGSWTASNSNASVNSSGVVTGVIAGTVTISYSVTNSCGSGIATKIITVNATVGPITGTLSLCAGSTITLADSVSGGSWNSSNTSVATINSAGVVTGGAAGTATISYVLGTSSVSAVVTVNPAADAGTVTGAASVMAGASITLSSAASGGAWSSSNSHATVSSTGVVTGVTAGTVTISYSVTNSCGSAIASKIITVNATVGPIAGTLSLCAGSTTTLADSISGGSWSSSNITVATINSAGVVTGAAAGTATISYVLGESSVSAVVTVNPTADAGSITGAASVMVGSSITLSNAATGGTWSASNSHATVGSTGVVTGVTAGAVTISYSVANSCGTAVAMKVVTVNEDAPTLSGTLTVCSGATTALGASIGGGTWSSGDASVATVSASGVATGVSDGVAVITYTTATSSATASVTVTAAPSITGSATLCPGSTTALSSSATGGTWTGGSTVVATVGSAGVVTGIAAGTTNITYSIGTGCNATITITVNSAPASITGAFKACPGTTTALSCMTTGGTWSSSDPTIATADAATGIVTGVAAGTITVTYAAGAGCYRTVTVTINPVPAAIGGSTMICTGSSTSLTDVTPGSSWSSSNTSVATISSTGVVAGVSAGNTIITYTAASTNCIATAIVTVNGVPATIGGPAAGCTGTSIALTNSVPGGAWSSSNTAVATVDPSTGVVTGIAAGMTTITYTAGAGCYKTKAITINNSPTVTGYPMACIGLTTTLSGGSSGTWSSSTPSVASITTSGGYVSGVSAGTSTMTFTSTTTTCPATYVVTVIATPSAITGATVGCQGSTVTLSNSTPGGLWSSNNTAIASVGSATGVVMAVGAGGTATISYSFGNCRVTAPFSPKPLPAVIGGSTSVCTPLTTTLTCTTGGGTWSSSDASVATIGSAISVGNGVVTGVAAGTANMTYTITSTGCARSAMVTINTGLNPGSITSSGGFTLHTVSVPTSVTLSSTGASGGTWISSNPAVATVNASTGVVTAVAAGTTTITYSVTGNCTNITTKIITVTAGRPVGSVLSGVGIVQLYPNPTTGAFTLVSEEAGTLNVFSIDGKEITSYTIAAGVNSLNLPRELASGVYMCKYTSESGSTTMVRLVYER